METVPLALEIELTYKYNAEKKRKNLKEKG